VQRHSHATMHEVFYVEKGRGVFMVDDEPRIIRHGHFVHVAPGEAHAVFNNAEADEEEPDLVLVYWGVAQ
jgi:quercetin dioxygenase-like cupin family protein